jgi:formate-dependent phosphoribosylglycinamide formyltransferase (GAR transformylase)
MQDATMTTLGTPLSPNATKVMLLGSGELGKEVLIALQRLGVETIAVDRYENAPGQQVAHHARTITMSDPAQLKALIEEVKPDLVVPEIEAIATPMLEELEAAGVITCIPTARAARLTMDREGIRETLASDSSCMQPPIPRPGITARVAMPRPTSTHPLRGASRDITAVRMPKAAWCLVVWSSSGAAQCTDRAPCKPESFVKRRMGVALARAGDVEQARVNAKLAASKVKPRLP